MHYKEIEMNFSSPEKLEELLQYCNKEYFEKINTISEAFINNVYSSPTDTDKALDELTGYYMNLIDIFKIAETFIENKEAEYFVGSGEMGTLTMLKKAAIISVANYRRVGNILEAYVDKCQTGILTCQSKLKYFTHELNLHK